MTFGASEVAEEVFVDLAEFVALRIDGDLRKVFQQRGQDQVIDLGVRSWQDAFEVDVLRLDRFHRLIDRLADILAFRQRQQIRETSFWRQVHHPFGLVVLLANLATTRTLAHQFLFRLRKAMVGIAEEDQPQNGNRVFR